MSFQTPSSTQTIFRDLGDGLVLRRATPDDAEALAAFNGDIHPEPGKVGPDLGVIAWTQDLMSGRHPTFPISDFMVVEDTRRPAIVSSLCLIDQTWTYGGIPFGVGRPELVGTHPDYRNRGLVRAQFEVMHEWSAARGQAVQAITGIPFYYRQFGYEMTVTLGGGRCGFLAQAPRLGEAEAEPYRLRPATRADIPAIMQLYGQYCAHSLLACRRDETLWAYEIEGRSAGNANRREVRMLETFAGRPAGLVLHTTKLWDQMLAVTLLELVLGTPWLTALPAVIRYQLATGAAYGVRDREECSGYRLGLGSDHPAYQAMPRSLPVVRRPYAWYLRVADLLGFLRLITPVLEQRLAGSPAAGYSGEITVSFYRSGLRLALEAGRLATVEPWQPQPKVWGNASFPGQTFLQLLFGYRSLEELRYAFPDCMVDNDRTAAILDGMFPKHISDVWPVD